MSEVREGNNGLAAHSEHLAKNPQWVSHRLQGLTQNDEIECTVRIIHEPLRDVALIDGYPARSCQPNLFTFDLHSAPAHLLMLGQPRQQLPFTAAKIQNTRARLYDLGDHCVVLPR